MPTGYATGSLWRSKENGGIYELTDAHWRDAGFLALKFKGVGDGEVFMIKSTNAEDYFEPYDVEQCGGPEPGSLWVASSTGAIWTLLCCSKGFFWMKDPNGGKYTISPEYFYENFEPLESSTPTPEPEEPERSQSFGSW